MTGITVINTGKTEQIATTQNHGFMEGRPHIRYATVEEYKQNPNFANDEIYEPQVYDPYKKSLWEPHSYDTGYQWGMTIDLSKCISCNACIVGCQAENNVPIVGKEEVLNGREMSWIRNDRYYEGDVDNPKLLDQTVVCLHCENAPCEQVCPVAATVHDDEGLNVMVYNRCVGTRYCSDNCPVKVRRFNFFDYHQRNPHSVKKDRFHLFDYIKEPAKPLAKQFNPDVSVRMRGIMEKCTYCIQRIKAATQTAKNENRTIKDGEVVTACQQACPTDGISFGNILDKNSKVFKQRNKKRNYSILEQLLLKARTTYLAQVVNPNTQLAYNGNKKRIMSVTTNNVIEGVTRPDLLDPSHDFESVSDVISKPMEGKLPSWWVIAFIAAVSGVLLLKAMLAYLVWEGIGIWGLNNPVGWGYAIVNFVFWVGIGHAGTLISAILFLFRQKWRTAINRFAEAMTIFAVICALIFPGVHIGRQWVAYWLFPLPNSMAMWPNFKAPIMGCICS